MKDTLEKRIIDLEQQVAKLILLQAAQDVRIKDLEDRLEGRIQSMAEGVARH